MRTELISDCHAETGAGVGGSGPTAASPCCFWAPDCMLGPWGRGQRVPGTGPELVSRLLQARPTGSRALPPGCCGRSRRSPGPSPCTASCCRRWGGRVGGWQQWAAATAVHRLRQHPLPSAQPAKLGAWNRLAPVSDYAPHLRPSCPTLLPPLLPRAPPSAGRSRTRCGA